MSSLASRLRSGIVPTLPFHRRIYGSVLGRVDVRLLPAYGDLGSADVPEGLLIWRDDFSVVRICADL